MIQGLASPTIALYGATAAAGDPTFLLTTTGDKVHIQVPFKCVVVRACVLLNKAATGAGVIKFDKRPTYASDTSRGDGDVAAITLTTTNAAGDVVYKDPTTQVELQPGEEVVVEVTTTTDVTEAMAWILVREVPEVAGNLTNMKAAV